MIELLGEEGSSEYAAAVAIRDALLKLWPGLDTSPREDELLKLSAGAKISGYQVSDLDVVVSARFRAGRRFIPKRIISDRQGMPAGNQPVSVPNLIIAVEVKDHDAAGIRQEGDAILVKYSRTGRVTWHSATDQNVAQAHALKEYFADQHTEVFVHRIVILRGVDRIDCAGVLPREFSGADLLTEITSVSRVNRNNSGLSLRSCSDTHIERVLGAPLFQRVLASSLDRRRMDRIATKRGRSEEWFGSLGSKLISLRGRGGSGKTVLLLQTAWRAYEERGLRTVFLTYNHALIGDVRRLMALLAIPEDPGSGGIIVDSVMSFMLTWFRRLGVFSGSEPDLLSKYSDYCAQTVQLLREGAITAEDIAAEKEKDPQRFDVDFVIVDEAQDWPQDEVEVLKRLYSPTQICIADGVDQLVRGARADWRIGIPAEQRLMCQLTHCLRMKANLAEFSNAVAEEAGLPWRLTPNDEAGGGRVIVLKGSYLDYRDLHSELIASAKAAGNEEIDFLFCVPPSNVHYGAGGGFSELGQVLTQRGLRVWDATNEQVRRDFPRLTDTYRIVQYASCRGLEGWTVVAESMDDFWADQFEKRRLQGGDRETGRSADQIAAEEAWRWCAIPLTRPIDTLVITLRDPNSPFSKAILNAADRYPDFVER